MFSVCDTYILRIVVEIKYFPGTAVLNMSVIGGIHPVFFLHSEFLIIWEAIPNGVKLVSAI